jgi:tetratricopeptide (TPR) repeat protein
LNFAIVRVNTAWMLVGVAVWLAAAWLTWRRSLLAVLLLTSLGLTCSALLVAVSPVAWTPIAERYMYVPLAPFLLGMVFSLGPHWLAGKSRLACGTLLMVTVIAFAATIFWRCWLWQDNLRLYQDTVAKSPEFAPARNELANALAERGRRAEGVAILENLSMPISQGVALSQEIVLIEKGDLEEARHLLNERLERTPKDSVEILEELIRVTYLMVKQSRDKELKARRYRDILVWLEALERLTHNPFHWYRQGRVYLLIGDRKNAGRCFAEAARRLPSESPYHAPAEKLAKKLVP